MPDQSLLHDGRELPTPIIQVALTPATAADAQRLRQALDRLAQDDPTFQWSVDTAGRTMLGGMGELHLEILVHKLREEHGVAMDIDAVQIAFRTQDRGGAAVQTEPIMRLTVTVPPATSDIAIADIGARRGEITSTEVTDDGIVINALVPLEAALGYAESLRSLSDKQGVYTMQFDSYVDAPEAAG
jgi:translation elongation factor EF-G